MLVAVRGNRADSASIGSTEAVYVPSIRITLAPASSRGMRFDVRGVRPATGDSVYATWQAERPRLRALPLLPEPFDVAVMRPVYRDCTVYFENRQYAVPFALVGRLHPRARERAPRLRRVQVDQYSAMNAVDVASSGPSCPSVPSDRCRRFSRTFRRQRLQFPPQVLVADLSAAFPQNHHVAQQPV